MEKIKHFLTKRHGFINIMHIMEVGGDEKNI